MTVVYSIEVLHVDRHQWFDDLRAAVAHEIRTLGLHRTVAVTVDDSRGGRDAPTVAVLLGSPAAASSNDIGEAAKQMMSDGLELLPVVTSLDDLHSELPSAALHLNARAYDIDPPARELARALLRALGIEDRERRVFISHKREDGLWAAERLFDALSHIAFEPFIDRFAIRDAADVQAEIADALEDHAFLLLLETPQAHLSEWVFDEIEYALAHAMALLIVSFPGDVTPVPGSDIGLPRIKLEEADLVTNEQGARVLSDEACDRVLAEVEAQHASGLVRRRRQILRSVEESAIASGATTTPLVGWRLLVESEAGQTVVGITPRLPTASDLQRLDEARAGYGDEPAAVLVHAARALRTDRLRHLEWVTGQRELEMLPENAVGARWS